MGFSPQLADIRFGCGLAPDVPSPASVPMMLDGLSGPDRMAQRFAVEDFDGFQARYQRMVLLHRQKREAANQADQAPLQDEITEIWMKTREEEVRWYGQILSRWRHSPNGFRERLVLFWKDHFTAMGKVGILRLGTQPYVESAIRPNVAGSFADLLIAAVTHPVMLQYLDQNVSAGPNSHAVAVKKRKGVGLNENLAREVLELHTLGVNGPYAQQDVRALAKLFTGMTFNSTGEFRFANGMAEPGAQQVLGSRYGGAKPQQARVLAVLRDLAVHPATAAHIAHKLAVHFVSDTPPPALVDDLTAAYLRSDGDLMAVYAVLLGHPDAWRPEPANVKPAFDYVASACRALGVEPQMLFDQAVRKARSRLQFPMAAMGQNWLRPSGPNGWPEEDDAWITPQGLSARIRWAMSVPRLLGSDLPEPADFVDTALGPFANDRVRFAASAAETRTEGVGLVLSSPAFQRR